MKKAPVFYINLEHRKDRRAEFEAEVSKIEPIVEFVERIPAVHTVENGAVGCAASHICALVRFVTSTSFNTAMIFEDDFEFSVAPEFALSTLSAAFDQMEHLAAIQLAYNRAIALKSPRPNLIRILKSTTVSGYIVNRSFAYKLLPTFLAAHQALTKISNLKPAQLTSDLAAIDVAWNSLQLSEEFYGLARPIGRQRKSYSDILKRVVDYGS